MDTESPYSNADSAVKSLEDGLTYFVKPFDSVCVFFKKIIVVCRPWCKWCFEQKMERLNARISARTSPGIRNLTLRSL